MLDQDPISAAVEGIIDEAVVRRLIEDAGRSVGAVYGREGKPALRRKIRGYNKAAHRLPWIVLVDLDSETECAPALQNEWLPSVAPLLCFRVAVRAVEAWFLADATNLARFLAIPKQRIPREPETVADPKRAIVDLARGSRKGSIRSVITPREGSGRSIGPAYPSRMIEFAMNLWTPSEAAVRADSLKRAMDCLRTID